ncbi:MAG: DUF1330 domain-containing protein [Xanthobacteraceae bacterium]
MPKAYWVGRVTIREPDRYPEYVETARPAFERYGAKFLVRGGAFDALEGTPRERNVVIEFPDRATALACYNSAEYQAAKRIRQQIADGDIVIVDGVA